MYLQTGLNIAGYYTAMYYGNLTQGIHIAALHIKVFNGQIPSNCQS